MLDGAPPEAAQGAYGSEWLPLAYLRQSYLDVEVRPPMPHAGDDEGSSSAELTIYPPMTSTVPDATFIASGQMLVCKTASTGARWLVTQRDDDLLTPEETCQPWREVKAAMLKQFKTWAELKRFSRKPRHPASNC